MNTNIPDDLMDNVERNLRNHILKKRRKSYMYKAAAAFIAVFIVLPLSGFAYARYESSIPYKQEVDLAVKNNNISKINKTFKYKNVSFNIKEIIADETGIEVIYSSSNPKYSISNFGFSGANNKSIIYGYSMPTPDPKENEKAFNITLDKDSINYIMNNPVKLHIKGLHYDSTGSIMDKINLALDGKSVKVDWTLNTKLMVQKVKTIPINKNYKLDVGDLKLKCLKEGVLKSIIEYEFVPNNKNVANDVQPDFAIRINNKYVDTSVGAGEEGNFEFKSVYYTKVDKVGIRLIGMNVRYDFGTVPKKYILKKGSYDFEGNKFSITSIKNNKDKSKEIDFKYESDNRTYTSLMLSFGDTIGYESNGSGHKKLTYVDQKNRDAIYNKLNNEIPNMSKYKNLYSYDSSTEKYTVKAAEKVNEFWIEEAQKYNLYDEDEIIIK
ncbi:MULTISPECIES: DUF4179 domain-containing protein [Clostridium]|uniref:DUF4179 domain-containing protein n=1 Tax=Clostridium TaxID=1485 RepID=UPI00082575E5|nr:MULTISPECIES: DUF4179 domain-containing protein [Clostridium]PJI09000.1 DUF4179 domain-containing protein [Clostridium sp. CT7]